MRYVLCETESGVWSSVQGEGRAETCSFEAIETQRRGWRRWGAGKQTPSGRGGVGRADIQERDLGEYIRAFNRTGLTSCSIYRAARIGGETVSLPSLGDHSERAWRDDQDTPWRQRREENERASVEPVGETSQRGENVRFNGFPNPSGTCPCQGSRL